MSTISSSCKEPGPSQPHELEHLDAVDPFQHFDDPDLLPAQPPSLRDQIIQIDIKLPFLDADESKPLSLAVNASPGCGGIAWPAGEVRF
jgi:hypothetical protein